MRFLLVFVTFLFFGCSLKHYTHQTSRIVLIKSPKLKYNDIGYIQFDDDGAIKLQLYSAGAAVESFTIDKKICIDKGCMSKRDFNAEYFVASYDEDILKEILLQRAIFGGRNLTKTQNGFEQHIRSKDYDIVYRVQKGTEVFFKDRKNKIIIKLKTVGE